VSVIAPYVRLHPAARAALNTHAPGHERRRLDRRDHTAYWRLLAEQWTRPGDLVIVEQDIAIHDGVIDGFTACREPWCGHPYLIADQLLICLGCTRFTAELKAAEPDLLDVVGQVGGDGLPAKDWRRLDVRLAAELELRGYQRHPHPGAVRHYHRYP